MPIKSNIQDILALTLNSRVGSTEKLSLTISEMKILSKTAMWNAANGRNSNFQEIPIKEHQDFIRNRNFVNHKCANMHGACLPNTILKDDVNFVQR